MPANNLDTSSRLFRSSWLPEIVAKIFAIRPQEKIWEWADREVFFDTTMAPEAGPYRSSKTPWTRRIQELMQHPYHNGHRIKRIVVKKSSQTGFTEAVLNGVRWRAKFAPCNVIYAIDSKEEAGNISDRLTKTLEALGEEIFKIPTQRHGRRNQDDIGKFKLNLRHMIVWFLGSFSSGKFANKQAPLVVCDEVEEHGKIAGDTSTVKNAASRMKKSAEGLLIELSKPKLVGGPIDEDHKLGNEEIFLVPCPHCGTFQEIVYERLKFDHCKTLTKEWDLERVTRETYLKCASDSCTTPIEEHHRAEMVQLGRWFGTHDGDVTRDPEIISQEMSDLYDADNPRVWGEIAKEMIDASGDHKKRQGVYNQRLGRSYALTTAKAEVIDVLKCKFAYRRGTIPWAPIALILGSDVGLNYAKWVVFAVNAANDIAIVDWGSELHPSGIAKLVLEARFHCPANGSYHNIWQAVIDAKYRKEETYSACMLAKRQMWPVMGGGGARARQAFAWGTVQSYPSWLRLLSFNDRDFKSELYIHRIKRLVPAELNQQQAKEFLERMPRLLVPENVSTDLIEELINEHLIDDEWVRKGANHWGDCIKNGLVFWRWAARAIFKNVVAFPTQSTGNLEEETSEAPRIAA